MTTTICRQAVILLVAGLALLPGSLPVVEAAPAPEDVTEPRLHKTVRWVKFRSTSVAFDGNGTLVALGDDTTGEVELRRLPDGTLLKKMRVAGIHGVRPCALTLSTDGKTLVTLAEDGKVRIYRTDAVGEVEIPVPQYVNCSPLALARDGRSLATVVHDHAIRQWDPVTAQSLAQPIEVGEIIDTLAWSPDGKLIAADYYEDPLVIRIGVWNAVTGKKIHARESFKTRMACLKFSPDGKTLAAGDQNGILKLIDAASGKCLHELKGHKDALWALAFSPDGKTLASAGARAEDGTVRLWDVATGKLRATLTPNGRGDVCALVFTRGGRTLWSGSKGGVLHCWDIPARWKAD
jgi:WD40 repeat protein